MYVPASIGSRERMDTLLQILFVTTCCRSRTPLTPPLSGRASGRSPLAKVRLEWLVSAHLGTAPGR